MKLVIENLNKSYSNGVKALSGVSLTIHQGMFGLLGPNGAGKSTLMRTLATLQDPDDGSILLNDVNLIERKEDVRKVLGYLPQEFGLYPKVSAYALLDHIAVLKGLTSRVERRARVNELLAKTNLWSVRHRHLGTFSGGMKQRFGIAQALIANPELIIVDEPTAGLDPSERNRFLNLLAEIGESAIIILSTHIVDDVRELCTRMAILNQGRVLFTGNPAFAIEDLQGKIWTKTVRRPELDACKSRWTVLSEKLSAGRHEIHVLSERQPDSTFVPAVAGLEHVYFAEIMRSDKALYKHSLS